MGTVRLQLLGKKAKAHTMHSVNHVFYQSTLGSSVRFNAILGNAPVVLASK
jgi:hypothetical protein